MYLFRFTLFVLSCSIVTAEDSDQGNNGEVRYSLEIDDDLTQIFTVDPHSGWISTLMHLDRERHQHYKLTLMASDNGHPKHSTRTIVHIQVQDYNDNPPTFSSNLYKASGKTSSLPTISFVSYFSVVCFLPFLLLFFLQ